MPILLFQCKRCLCEFECLRWHGEQSPVICDQCGAGETVQVVPLRLMANRKYHEMAISSTDRGQARYMEWYKEAIKSGRYAPIPVSQARNEIEEAMTPLDPYMKWKQAEEQKEKLALEMEDIHKEATQIMKATKGDPVKVHEVLVKAGIRR